MPASLVPVPASFQRTGWTAEAAVAALKAGFQLSCSSPMQQPRSAEAGSAAVCTKMKAAVVDGSREKLAVAAAAVSRVNLAVVRLSAASRANQAVVSKASLAVQPGRRVSLVAVSVVAVVDTASRVKLVVLLGRRASLAAVVVAVAGFGEVVEGALVVPLVQLLMVERGGCLHLVDRMMMGGSLVLGGDLVDLFEVQLMYREIDLRRFLGFSSFQIRRMI